MRLVITDEQGKQTSAPMPNIFKWTGQKFDWKCRGCWGTLWWDVRQRIKCFFLEWAQRNPNVPPHIHEAVSAKLKLIIEAYREYDELVQQECYLYTHRLKHGKEQTPTPR